MNNPFSHIIASFMRQSFRAACLCLALICIQATVKAQTPSARPEQVKAAFLYHFTQFVKWPESTFSQPDAPFVIGILGNDPFGSYLDKIIAGENIDGRSIIVIRYADVSKIGDCHILYIDRKLLPAALGKIDYRNMLTVSDAASFTNSGGMVRFFTEQNKVRFEINLATAKSAGLDISSKLLRLAKVIE